MFNSECSRHGVCSISPNIAAFREIVKIILKTSAYYLEKLTYFGIDLKKEKLDIINSLAGMLLTADCSDDQMFDTLIRYYNNFIKIKKKYICACKNRGIKPVYKKNALKITSEMSFSDLLFQGQKIIFSAAKQKNLNKKCYAELVIILLINAAHSLIKLADYTNIGDEYINAVISAFSGSYGKKTLEKLIDINADLLLKRYHAQSENLGKISKTYVNKSSVMGKAILVTGSNLLDLYNLLTEIREINVYTHGNLLLAHAYKGFEKFKNLKGHFSTGENNYDFSNFPGAIYLTKHSAFNLSNLFRGKIFSYDNINAKNVVKLKSFEELKEYTNKVDGFKNSHNLSTIQVGFSENELSEKLCTFNTNKIVITCNLDPSYKLNSSINADIILDSTTNENINTENFYINTGGNAPFQYYLINKLSEHIPNENAEFYFTSCDYNTITIMLILYKAGVKNLYLSECPPTVINPVIRKKFMSIFNIKEIKKSP